MRTTVLLVILLVTLWPAAGCQEAARTGDAARPDPPAPAVVIQMTGFRFEPARVTVKAGDAVQWKNVTFLTSHTATADPAVAEKPQNAGVPPGAHPFDSGQIMPGESFTYVFTLPGTYRYVCADHQAWGMMGEIQVEPASPAKPPERVAEGNKVAVDSAAK